jgi:hypothetical protein
VLNRCGVLPLVGCLLVATALSGCGGEGSDGAAGVAAVPVDRSPGGVWGTAPGAGDSLSMVVAEDGELWVGSVDLYGAGSLAVDGSGRVSGSYRATQRSAVTFPIPQVPRERTCTVTGTLVARASLTLNQRCVVSTGEQLEEERTLIYISSAYEQPSSLALIAGNYTMKNFSAANMLNINSDGEIFGMYANGPRCTINGRVRVIDPRFNLYRAEWTFASCDSRSAAYEGVRFSGYVTRNPVLADQSSVYTALGSFLITLAGEVSSRQTQIGVIYDPT